MTNATHALTAPQLSERLGSKADDITAIKTHQWFAGFDWGGVQAGDSFNQASAKGGGKRFFCCVRLYFINSAVINYGQLR